MSDLTRCDVEDIIKDYLQNCLSVNIYHQFVGCNELRIRVVVSMSEDEITQDWTDISLDNI